jgi:hypothetical protein
MPQFSSQIAVFRRANLVFGTSALWVTPVLDLRFYRNATVQWSLVAGTPAAAGAVSQWQWYKTAWPLDSNPNAAQDNAGRPQRPVDAAYRQILEDGSSVAVGAGQARNDVWILDGAIQFGDIPGDVGNPVSSDFAVIDNSKSALIGVLTIAADVNNLSLFLSAYGG